MKKEDDMLSFKFGNATDSFINSLAKAQRIYLENYHILSGYRVGSPEVHALRDRLVRDEEFRDAARDILELKMQGPVWMDAFFRVAARRALEYEDKEARADRTAADTSFGAF